MVEVNTWADIGRLVNVILGGTTLIWLLTRRTLNQKLYQKNLMRNDIWFMSVFWLSAVLAGSIEQLYETNTSIRVVFVTGSILVTLKILFRPKEDWGDLEL